LLAAAASAPALADEVDLTPRSRGEGRPPTFVLRAEGGSDFAPYGYAGACLSWLTGSGLEIEAGGGAGFPGLQLGLAARFLFGERGGYMVSEIAIAGNTRVNRNGPNTAFNPNTTNSSLWTNLGLGFEQRESFYSFSVVGSIVFTTQSLTPHFAIHGGIGFGF
jgi:hypothetical protein